MTQIASGEVKVSINDGDLRTKLKEDEARVRETFNKIGKIRAEPKIGLDKSEFNRELKEVQTQLKKVAGQKATAVIKADTKGVAEAETKLKALEAQAEHLERTYHLRFEMDRSILGRLQAFRENVKNNDTALTGWIKNIGNTRVRVLGLGLTLTSLGATILALAPVIASLSGGIVALGGVALAGLTGALVVAGAGIASFVTGLGGVAAVAAPLIGDIKKVTDASKAYDKAVLENGKNSEKAQKAMEKMQTIMGHIPKENAQAVASIGDLGDTWTKLTKSARPDFWNTFSEGIRTVKKLMPEFAKDSVGAFKTVSHGVQDWLAGLRSSEARGIIHGLFDGFKASAPDVMKSLGNIATALGRVFAAAQPLVHSFTSWMKGLTQGWANSAKDGDKLTGTLKSLGAAAASLGKFMISAGRLIATFFLSGSTAGKSLIDTLTKVFDRWTSWLKTAKGQKEMSDFFTKSIALLKQLGSILATVIGAFSRLAAALMPIVTPLLNIVRAIMQSKAAATAFAAVLASIWAVGKVIAFATAIGKVAAALKVAGVASAAFAATQGGFMARGGAALAAGGAASRGAAAVGAAESAAGGAAASKIASTGTAAAASTGRLAAFAAAATGVASVMASLALPVGAVALGIYGLNKAMGFRSAGDKFADQVRNLTGLYKQEAAQANQSKAAQEALLPAYTQQRDTLAALKSVKEQKRQGDIKGMEAVRALDAAEAAHNKAVQAAVSTQNAAKEKSEQQAQTAGKLLDKFQQLKKSGWGVPDSQITKAANDYTEALNKQEAATLNVQRAQQGLSAITGPAAAKLGSLVKQFSNIKGGNVVSNFLVKADTTSATKAVGILQKLKDLGGSQVAVHVLATTKDPETAVKRLHTALQAVEKGKFLATIGAKDQASKVVSAAQLKLMGLTRKQWTAMLGANDGVSGKAKSVLGIVQSLAKTFTTTIAANDSASNVISNIISSLGRIPRVIGVAVNVVKHAIGGHATGGVQGFADGGVAPTRGQIVNRPTFLTGEENRKEYVLATNPAYRKKNQGLWVQAGHDLGIPGFAEGGVRGKAAKNVTKGQRKWKLSHSPVHKPRNFNNRGGTPEIRDIRRIEGQQGDTSRQINLEESRREPNIQTIVGLYQTLLTQLAYEIEKAPTAIKAVEKERDASIKNAVKLKKEKAKQEKKLHEETKKLHENETKIKQQQEKIRKERQKKKPSKSTINSANDVIAKLEKQNRAIKKEIGYDTKQISKIEEDLKAEDEIQRDTTDDIKMLQDRQKELPWQRQETEIGLDKAQNPEVKEVPIKEPDAVYASPSGSETAGGASTVDPDTSLRDAQFAQAQQRAQIAETKSGLSEAALSVFGGSGDIGSGGFSNAFMAALGTTTSGLVNSAAAATNAVSAPATGSSTGGRTSAEASQTIVVNTLHPGDPSTLSAIGDAAASGFGLQGFVSSPRLATGI
jgi:hypothetical protein